jgi:hypothetical protein
MTFAPIGNELHVCTMEHLESANASGPGRFAAIESVTVLIGEAIAQ